MSSASTRAYFANPPIVCLMCEDAPHPCDTCMDARDHANRHLKWPERIKARGHYSHAGQLFEMGEERLEESGLISYHYYGRRNGGDWVPLAPYGNRFPPEWFDGGYIPLEADTINLGSITPGYHLADIPRGTFGESDKIVEEIAEFQDAVDQGCKVMALVELSDAVGAIQGYLDKHHAGTTIDDLCMMAAITKRAFTSGQRVSRQ